MGLPGAVSWRWPPPLKPQQGFALRAEQKRRSGPTAPLPPPPMRTHTPTHSHLPLSANEHPCFLPFQCGLPPSLSSPPLGCFFFFLFFWLYIAPSSICFLLVYKEQLFSGGLHFLTSTCVGLFFTHCCYKSAQSVHSYIINVCVLPAVHLSPLLSQIETLAACEGHFRFPVCVCVCLLKLDFKRAAENDQTNFFMSCFCLFLCFLLLADFADFVSTR